ncbi:WD40-repeat-containing domain protein [Parasitella parasitica]|nr:WD40-repeat-containing domain protein [Parasitella parasitica]
MSDLKRYRVSKNNWKTPIEGSEFDFEGPSADYLIEPSHLYDQVIYQNIHAVKEEWSLTDKSDALSYLPIMKDPLRVVLGIDEKKTIDIPNGESIKLDDYFRYKKGYVINTGGSIWGLDFAPKLHNDTDPATQYLAVAGYKGTVSEHHEIDEIQPAGTYKNAIQIWRLRLSTKQQSEDAILDMCLLHDFGVIHDLKWCPYGVYEDEDVNEGLPKLGLLAISCGDGTVRVIVVPHPNAVRKYMCPEDTDPHKTLYLRIESSRCTFALEASKSLAIAWGGHKKIAAGYTNGVVAVWDVESALNSHETCTKENSKKYMKLSFYCLDSGVRCITWNGHDNPDRLLFGGYDGQLVLVDTNDPFIHLVLNRARSIMHSCSWPGHSSMMLFNDGENMVRGISLNSDGSISTGRYGELPGMCWSIATSEFHGQYASGTAAGYVHSANIYHIKGKGLNSINVVHRLFYNETTNEYRYIDGMGLLNVTEARTISSYPVYSKTQMAIQRVVWNPNQPTCGFLASGGASGLCRVEFEGRGSKWI